jgi:hypothetical protein
VNSAPGGKFTASQRRKPLSLDLNHSGALKVTISKCQQGLCPIEQNRWSLRKFRQRRGRRKARRANAKRWIYNARSKYLKSRKHWFVQTMSLRQLSWAYIHRPTPESPKPPRNGPVRGSWVCCCCRTTNNPTHCPVRCPLDGHYKCTNCYIYR